MSPEQWQIWRFAQLEEAVPSGILEFSDKPDALLRAGSTLLGIEHTRIFQPQTPGRDLLAFERVTDSVVAQAHELFQAKRTEALHVGVHFDDRIVLTKRDRRKIAYDLSELIREFVPPVGGDWRLEAWQFQRRGRAFPRGVESIWIDRWPYDSTPQWSADRAGVVPPLTPSRVQQEINGKEAKVSSYRKRCSRVWLLLVVEGSSPASHWDLDRFPFDHQFSFSFDRVFLYHLFSGETWELQRHGDYLIEPGSSFTD